MALFLCLAGGLMAVKSTLAPPALARMRVERLAVQPTGGGAPRIFSVEIAATEQEKAVGLMFRSRMSDSEGMLFHYGSEQIVTMWMRNTYIPLDMAFIKANGVIYRIEARTQPLSERIISSEAPVAAVLEIAGGAAERLGLKPGDRVLHPAFGTKAPP